METRGGRGGRGEGLLGGTVGQYQPAPGVSRRKSHSGSGSTELGRKRHQDAVARRSSQGGT